MWQHLTPKMNLPACWQFVFVCRAHSCFSSARICISKCNNMSEAMDSNDSSVFVSPSGSTGIPKKRVRKLKEKVEVREGTWNFLSSEYRDRNLREAQWQDVADKLKMPRSEVSAKWNSLRCSFRVSTFAILITKGQTKSGQGAERATAMNPLYKSLQFLEPTLQVEANTTSNLGNKCSTPLTSPGSPCDTITNVDSDDSQTTPSTSRAAVGRRRAHKDDDGFSEVVERALETMSAAGKSDAWDDLGNFIASNGREWAAETPQLAKEFKADMFKLVCNYQEKFARPKTPDFL